MKAIKTRLERLEAKTSPAIPALPEIVHEITEPGTFGPVLVARMIRRAGGVLEAAPDDGRGPLPRPWRSAGDGEAA
ncbi:MULTISPECIES: hypothetical protein [Acidocella]|uniref:hypothetical protein n=1 Tax=Acidocella TaxID=50709 RepID=UPI001F41F69B|nr:hypothetical protein [Acidocella facilis]